MTDRKPMTYKEAGHDLERSDAIIENLRRRIPTIGGFGGVFPLPPGQYEEPVLFSSTDGVGTKLLVAIQANKHDTVGIDLVAMVVNDLIVSGADPLFFLDYIAAGKLEPDTIEALVSGILEGCRQAGCELIGGETAELAGMYADGHYDLAGFGVGIVERNAIVDGGTIQAGDAVLGLGSSGLHSNGYSLARKVFERQERTAGDWIEELGSNVSDALLEPTRIYVRPVIDLIENFPVRGMANITGGGIPGNLNRILPEDCDAEIEKNSWPKHAIFKVLQETGPVEEDEMFRTFNMGIGFALVVPEEEAQRAVNHADSLGFPAHVIGRIVKGSGRVNLV